MHQGEYFRTNNCKYCDLAPTEEPVALRKPDSRVCEETNLVDEPPALVGECQCINNVIASLVTGFPSADEGDASRREQGASLEQPLPVLNGELNYNYSYCPPPPLPPPLLWCMLHLQENRVPCLANLILLVGGIIQ